MREIEKKELQRNIYFVVCITATRSKGVKEQIDSALKFPVRRNRASKE